MSFDTFRDIYLYLMEKGIIGANTDIGLFNWGEPFLNMDLHKICAFLSEKKQPFHLSTNASVFKPEVVKNSESLTSMTFSMCGFSQRSYNRIHGFSFAKIIENIEKYVVEYRKYGYKGYFFIAYHIYQFNEEEMQDAYNFACKLGIGIHFSYAFLNGVSLGLDYMDNTLSYNSLKQMGKDINLGYIDELIAQKDKDEICKELERLVVDEEGNMLVCCGVDRKCSNYYMGKVFDFDNYNDVCQKRNDIVSNSPVCKKCLDYGLHYWTHNPPVKHVKDKKYWIIYSGKAKRMLIKMYRIFSRRYR